MDVLGVPATPEVAARAVGDGESTLNLTAWFHRGWAGAAGLGEKGIELVGNMLDRIREADALGYDNEGEESEN